MNGILYIVATPIGNLEDITLRAVKVLGNVDLIAAEDTRTTRILLDHYKVNKPLVSYHDFNERQRAPELIAKMKSGMSVALVSDAGVPGISDPGFVVIREAIAEDIPVVAVPGPSAFLTALVVSGAPIDRFIFAGFLPHKKGRRTRLAELSNETKTIVLYESPHRLLRTLRDLRESLGNRSVVLARELTKKFEEVLRGRIADLLRKLEGRSIKGEFVIVVFPA